MADSQKNKKFGDQPAITLLRSAIEDKLGWGRGDDWSGSDFSRLSQLVFEETGKRLSVSTLKRVWGRTSAQIRASRTTLDILAAFAGRESWRTIVSRAGGGAGEELFPQPAGSYHWLGIGLAVGALLFCFGFVFYSSSVKVLGPGKSIDPDRVTFSVEKVTSGIPNTVIFRYDLGGQQVDSLELQQSWDARRRELLDTSQVMVTSIYHSPGYYLAKLIADGIVLDSQHVYLPTDGLEVAEIREKGMETHYRSLVPWTLDKGVLTYGSDYKSSLMEGDLLGYHLSNLLPLPVIDRDSFALRMDLRLSQGLTDDHCNPLSIFLTGAEDVYYFALGHPGCAGDFQFYLGGESMSGKYHDLSRFGFSEEEWVSVEVTKNGKELSLMVNGNTLNISDEAPSIGRIGGVVIQATGLVELRRLTVSDPVRVVDLLDGGNPR